MRCNFLASEAARCKKVASKIFQTPSNGDTMYSTKNTKVIAIPHIISVYGTVMPIKEICDFARSKGIFTVIDGAQSVGQIDVDLKKLNCGSLLFLS